MPKRIIDGEALWTSQRVKRLKPENRLHYPYWIAMTWFNGVMEADMEAVRSKCYSYMFPEVTVDRIADIFADFVDTGLVGTWEQDGRTYAYFRGSDATGRTLPPSEKKNYKQPSWAPNPPEDVRKGEEMSIQKKINAIYLAAKAKALPRNSTGWDRIKEHSAAYKDTAIVSDFKVWLADFGSYDYDDPVAAYAKALPTRVTGPECVNASLVSAHDAAIQRAGLSSDDLVDAILDVCQGELTFDQKSKKVLVDLMEEGYTEAELLSAFRTFYDQNQNDAFKMKMGVKLFVESADQLVRFARRKALKDVQTKDQLADIAATLKEEARQALEDAERKEREEQELVPNEL